MTTFIKAKLKKSDGQTNEHLQIKSSNSYPNYLVWTKIRANISKIS